MGRVVLAGVAAALLVGAGSAHAGVVVRPRFAHVILRTAPGGGSVVARLGRRTEFGSPLAWSVKARRGRWIGVLAPQRPNGRLAWIDVRALRISKDAVRIDVSLSRRMLWLRRAPPCADGGLRAVPAGDGGSAHGFAGVGEPAEPPSWP